MEVLGLTSEEKRLLFGGDEAVGFGLRSGVDQPNFAVMFAQQKADGGEILTVIYNVKFSPAGINAVTLEEGQVEEQTASLEFTAIEKPNDNIFFFAVDTKEEGAEALAQAWFTEVQEPQA